MAEKIYCGVAKIRKTSFGDQTQISLSRDDVKKIAQHMKDEDLTWININIKEKREVVEGKPTHYLEVDTWKPDPNYKKDAQQGVVLKGADVDDSGGDSLPF